MFRCLYAVSGQFLTVDHDKAAKQLTVRVDKSKISSHGRPAIGRLLLQLHLHRCTADIEGCRKFYGMITEPDEQLLEWRETMLGNQPPKQIFAQPNTFIQGDDIVLQDYEASVEGVIQSWAERMV